MVCVSVRLQQKMDCYKPEYLDLLRSDKQSLYLLIVRKAMEHTLSERFEGNCLNGFDAWMEKTGAPYHFEDDSDFSYYEVCRALSLIEDRTCGDGACVWCETALD